MEQERLQLDRQHMSHCTAPGMDAHSFNNKPIPNVLREALFMVGCRDYLIVSIKHTWSVSTNRHPIACRNSSVKQIDSSGNLP